MRPAVTIRHTLAVLLSMLTLGSGGRAMAQSTVLRDYVVFATNEFRTRGLQVQRGDVGVNDGDFSVPNGFVSAPLSELSGTTVLVPSDATCRQQVVGRSFFSAPLCPSIQNFSRPFTD